MLHSWPVVDGTVSGGRVRGFVGGVGKGSSSRSCGAEFSIRYKVNGKDYKGVVTPELHNSCSDAEIDLNSSPIGTHRLIRYDPSNLTRISSDVNVGIFREYSFPLIWTSFGFMGVIVSLVVRKLAHLKG